TKVPSERLTIRYAPEDVARLTALHDEAGEWFPEPPPMELLERIQVVEDELAAAANDQVRAFAVELRAAGKRPWFEVWYPQTSTADFDAVEVDEAGNIATLPPYAVLLGGA